MAAATERLAGAARAAAAFLVQVVERIAALLAAVAQRGGAADVEEGARVRNGEGSVEVSHGIDGNKALIGSLIFGNGLCNELAGAKNSTRLYALDTLTA